MSGQSRRWRSNIESNKSDFARQVCPEIPGVQFPRDQNIKFHISNFLLKYLPHVSNLYFEKKAQTMLCCHSTIIILLLPPFLLWLCRQLIRHQLWHLLHLPHKVKGQEEDVLTHLFFRLLTKLFIVISGIRMKSPSPTVVWSAMMTAGKIPHCYNCPQLPNCHWGIHGLPSESSSGPTWTGAVAASWAGGTPATIQPPYNDGEPHRRFNRHDPALNISIVIVIYTVFNIIRNHENRLPTF